MFCAPAQTLRLSPQPRPLLPLTRCSGSTSSPPSFAGNIRHQVLPPEGLAKLDLRSGRDFYAFPRLVKHVDDGFLATLTDLYRERLRPDSDVLDLMRSWVSHLPLEIRVVGHGLNTQGLAKNPRLDYFVSDLNREQRLD